VALGVAIIVSRPAGSRTWKAETLEVPVIVTKQAASGQPADDVEVSLEVKPFVARMMRLPVQKEEALVWELTIQGHVPRD
jgi:hypothetical protein